MRSIFDGGCECDHGESNVSYFQLPASADTAGCIFRSPSAQYQVTQSFFGLLMLKARPFVA